MLQGQIDYKSNEVSYVNIPMRIAILTSAHPVLDVRIYHKQAISLAQAGYEVTLIGPYDPLAESAMNQFGIVYQSLYPLGSRLLRIRQWVRMMSYLRGEQFNTWHFHDPELLPLAIFWKFCFRRQTRLVYDMHEDIQKSILDKSWIPWMFRRLISSIVDKIEGWGIGKCDLVVAATDSIAASAGRFTSRVVIVRNFPKSIAKKTGYPRTVDESVQLIYAGNITEIRGLREVLQAMNLVKDCNVVLNLAGLFYPDTFEREIRALAGSNVRIYGKISFEETMALMGKCDVGIVTFLPLPNHIEAMPNKLFEYMQNGLAVIASDFPLWEKIIKETGCGITVNPLNPDEIARAIRLLVDNPELQKEMGQAGVREISRNYSWEQENKTLLDAYQRLANG